jgi:hypothetical protein
MAEYWSNSAETSYYWLFNDSSKKVEKQDDDRGMQNLKDLLYDNAIRIIKYLGSRIEHAINSCRLLMD